jgi:hypothetical protein
LLPLCLQNCYPNTPNATTDPRVTARKAVMMAERRICGVILIPPVVWLPCQAERVSATEPRKKQQRRHSAAKLGIVEPAVTPLVYPEKEARHGGDGRE